MYIAHEFFFFFFNIFIQIETVALKAVGLPEDECGLGSGCCIMVVVVSWWWLYVVPQAMRQVLHTGRHCWLKTFDA